MNLSIKLNSLTLTNPIMPGSGPLTGDSEKMIAISKTGVGALVTKTIAPEGAKVVRPCIYGGKNYIYNNELWSEHPAIDWIEKYLPETKEQTDTPLIVNIGYSVEDIQQTIPKIDKYADGYELNPRYSSDNLQTVGELVKKAIELTDKPIWVKMNCNLSNPVEFAKIAVRNGAVGVVASSSYGPSMAIDLEKRATKIGNEDGYVWTSGPIIKPIILGVVHQVKKELPNISIISSGGVSSADDVIEFLLAGADAVQLLSIAMIKGRSMYNKILEDLPVALEKYGFASIEEVRNTRLKKKESKYKPSFPIIENEKCNICNICYDNCPYFAIENKDNSIQVDQEKCFGCGLCESRCPKKAITGIL